MQTYSMVFNVRLILTQYYMWYGFQWTFLITLSFRACFSNHTFSASAITELLKCDVLEVNPYPANVENMVRKWQMGFNSAFKGLIYKWRYIV